MNEGVVFAVVFIGIIVIAVVASVFQTKMRKKREADLAAFAARNGFTMYPNEEPGCGSFMSNYSTGSSLFGSNDMVAGGQISGRLGTMFGLFSPFGAGHSRMIYNVVAGELPWSTFYTYDYRYVTGSGKSRQVHEHGIVAFRVPLSFTKLSIRSEGFLDKIGGALGLRDIQFESDEFNREYHVSCDDDRFAFDILHPSMMQFFLSLPRLSWQMMGPYIVLVNNGDWPVGSLPGIIETAEQFVQLIPDYVRQDIGFQPNWTSSFD